MPHKSAGVWNVSGSVRSTYTQDGAVLLDVEKRSLLQPERGRGQGMEHLGRMPAGDRVRETRGHHARAF